MSIKTDNLLTKGLAVGYAGTQKPKLVERVGFTGASNHFVSSNGTYHDEWFADKNGGGQELVIAGKESATRLYGGGVSSTEELTQLGLTAGDVIQRLIVSVQQLGGKTRLHEPCSLELPDGWRYVYTILKKSEKVPLTIGYESILYNGREVFAHGHILSSIK
ncbi:hypothetical protein COU88_05625 [Candidatus Roizmanbacteria bacterium CG10_big_fil_rev_8_21_14_0_10_39_6]|uniref:Uncharacterized protein n=1 Tax=Candidatus Roizmanbacteria bacterium CG10_big_fil_rev_8_21_14_0_10_39_6 TaxID=1974853 RepID=A0A2M8KQW5_9BACT|nr:MAG: hypothetical protein COU88_05625 [Candidatus Roizmanbacteria bacterium CG10_big_fil_rev_8_21_14_0_10_39_6]